MLFTIWSKGRVMWKTHEMGLSISCDYHSTKKKKLYLSLKIEDRCLQSTWMIQKLDYIRPLVSVTTTEENHKCSECIEDCTTMLDSFFPQHCPASTKDTLPFNKCRIFTVCALFALRGLPYFLTLLFWKAYCIFTKLGAEKHSADHTISTQLTIMWNWLEIWAV
jgi:hypothetical protein